ncbi:cyclase family protein [Sinomonas sp. ASV486]|uniref:cyclase family protein n=1 Tax=Sinomonas sp. ASV486 TaxID=3051170 RepID=UPI0027DAE4C4|nr:cyclase family protein [Sinomonas sp. ASV486]MDQ4489798.1 cyclase family protein [Sinomonas sp. ASV486]
MNAEAEAPEDGPDASAAFPSQIIQLGHVLGPGTVNGPVSPPYEYRLNHPHAAFDPGTPIVEGTISSASDAIALGDHTGTHVDSLAHVAEGGLLWDGTDIRSSGGQDDRAGVSASQRVELQPIVARGVLLDFPRYFGGRVAADTRLTPEHLAGCAAAQGVRLRNGDAVLLRTGWDELYGDPQRFLAGPQPGPELEAARYLSGLRASIVGSDTMPFEAAPAVQPLAVHAELIARNGIQIMEMLDLRELARQGIHTFTFVLAPLRIQGGTGSPVNPLALIP